MAKIIVSSDRQGVDSVRVGDKLIRLGVPVETNKEVVEQLENAGFTVEDTKGDASPPEDLSQAGQEGGGDNAPPDAPPTP